MSHRDWRDWRTSHPCLFSKASFIWLGLTVALGDFESVLDHFNVSRESGDLKFHLSTPNLKILLTTSIVVAL